MKMQPSSLEQMAYDRTHPEEVNCMNCDGACCRAGLFLAVRESEAEVVIQPVRWLKRPDIMPQTTRKRVKMVRQDANGARFVEKPRIIELPKHHGLVELKEDCLQLGEGGECGIYEGRPGQCRDGLEPGSPECLGYRAVYAARLAGELD